MESLKENIENDIFMSKTGITKEYIEDAVMMSKTGITDAKKDTLFNIFKELYELSHFSIKRETDAKRLGTLDAKVNRLRKELLSLLRELGHGVKRHKLVMELEEPIQTKRLEALYTKKAEDYTNQLLECGFSKDEINRIYRPAIKRYIKNPQNDPFFINK